MEGRIYSEENVVFVAHVERPTGTTLGFQLAECSSPENAQEVAKRCDQFAGLVAALSFALPYARAAWMQALNNAPQGEAAYGRWAALPSWRQLDEGLKAAEAALSAAK